MILQVKNENINWLVEHIVGNQEILKLKPVIAGGSMLSVYRAIKFFDTDKKILELKRGLTNDVKSIKSKIDSFGDVDYFFLENSPIFLSDHFANFLVKDYDEKIHSSPYKYDYMDIDKNKSNFGLTALSRSTGWANSFVSKNKNLHKGTSQFIKKGSKSVDSLLSSFDFINCCVAWHDGVFFYDSRIDDCFDSFELRLNNNKGIASKSIASRVFNALRAFKYSDRFGLDFDKELSDYIFNLYIDCKDIDYESYNTRVLELESVYGKRLSNVNTLRGMVEGFQSFFKKFAKMKFFKEEYLIFLLDQESSLSGLKEAVMNSSPTIPKVDAMLCKPKGNKFKKIYA